MQWEPIETAPKDGSDVLAGHTLKWGMVAVPGCPMRWQEGKWHAHFGGDTYKPVEPQPTHWMPLPSPPESA
jgi:hypothetical protein